MKTIADVFDELLERDPQQAEFWFDMENNRLWKELVGTPDIDGLARQLELQHFDLANIDQAIDLWERCLKQLHLWREAIARAKELHKRSE